MDLGDEFGVDWRAVKARFQWKGRGGRSLIFAKAEDENCRWLSLSGCSLSQGGERCGRRGIEAGFIKGWNGAGALWI